MDRSFTCRDTTYLVSEASERELTPPEKRLLERHTSECAYCKSASTQFAVLFRQIGLYFRE